MLTDGSGEIAVDVAADAASKEQEGGRLRVESGGVVASCALP